jgi:hypothetical protein
MAAVWLAVAPNGAGMLPGTLTLVRCRVSRNGVHVPQSTRPRAGRKGESPVCADGPVPGDILANFLLYTKKLSL